MVRPGDHAADGGRLLPRVVRPGDHATDGERLFVASSDQSVWCFTPTGGQQWRYRTPNPLYDSTIVRRDREWRFVLGVDVPITNRVGGFAQLVYANVDSNLPNFAYTNLAVSFGPSIRF